MSHPQTELTTADYLVPPREMEASGASAADGTKRLTVTRVLRRCWRKRRLVRSIFAVVVLSAIVYLVFQKPTFSSSTTLMPPDNTSNTSNLMALLATTPGAAATASSLLPGVKTPSAIFVGLLQSRTAQEYVVQRFNLQAHYKKKYLEDACKELTSNTSVDENAKNGIVTITVQDHDPILASQMATAYVEALNEINSKNSTSSARRERIFLEGRIKEINYDLQTSSQLLSQFSTKTMAIDPQGQGRAMVEEGLKLQAELAIAKSDYAGILKQYSRDNLRVRSASARIGELEHEISKINGSPSSGDNSMAGDGSSAYPSISALPQLGVTFADLSRRVTVDEALWAALTKQYESAKVQEAKEIPTVRVLDAAQIPKRKSSMGGLMILLLALFIGAILSVIAVLLSSVWEDLSEQDERKQLVREIFKRA